MLFALSSALLLGCPVLLPPSSSPSQQAAVSEVAQAEAEVSYVRLYESGGIAQRDLLGAWRMSGYGFVFFLEEGGMRAFCETKAGSWELDPDGFLGSSDFFVAAADSGDHVRITMDPLQSPYQLERLAQLPAACLDETEWTPTRIFDVFAGTMAENYPFFEIRGFDWVGRCAAAREAVHDEMSELELFQTLSATLADLGDGHVSLSANIDGVDHGIASPTSLIRRRVEATFPKDLSPEQRELRGRTEMREVYRSIRRGIREEILAGKGQIAADSFLWGKVAGDVGYIKIDGMGFDESMPQAEQVQRIHSAFDEMLAGLAGVDAMVLDCSMNGGGMDTISHAIAAHFIEARCQPYSKGPGTLPEIQHPITLEPWSGTRFTGPTFLISSDLTASAAEIFQLCLKDQEHVTLVGARAAMIFSDVIPKTLPNGWSLGISVETYRDAAGVCFEGIGIPTDVEVPIFEGEDLHTTHLEALMRVLDLVWESR